MHTFLACCEQVACPYPNASTFLMIAVGGGHTYHGLNSNQLIATIFLKSLCHIDLKKFF